MKQVLLVIIVTSLFSCHGKKNVKSLEWVLDSKSKYLHTYTKEGYLDSSFITQLKFKNGLLMDSIEYLVTRKYDHNRIINQLQYIKKPNGFYVIAERYNYF